MHRFFVPPEWIDKPKVTLVDKVAHQMRNVLRMRPGTKILFISGYPKETTIGRDGLPDDIVLLRKPLRRDLLLDAVQTAIGNRGLVRDDD